MATKIEPIIILSEKPTFAEFVEAIRRDVQIWNRWRSEHQGGVVDLAKANFSYRNLTGANFRFCNLSYANFNECVLLDVELDGADLRGAIYTYSTMTRETLKRFHEETDKTISIQG